MNELLMTIGGGAHLALINDQPSRLRAGLAWQDQALCAQVDTDLFFPERGQPSEAAKRVCAMCPVRQECLAYALARDLLGVWGGTSERQRLQLQQRRVRAHWARPPAA